VLDVPGFTLLQTCTPPAALGRVLGVLEGLMVGAVAAGSVVAGLLLPAVGTSPLLLAAGAAVPLAVLGCGRALRHLGS
jgi:hypothetical protein